MLGTQRKIPELHAANQSLTTKRAGRGGITVEISAFQSGRSSFFQIQEKRINYIWLQRRTS